MFINFLRWHHLINEARERRELFTQMSILSFAFSLVSVFMPIYLYVLGYSMLHIITYFFVVRICHVLFFLPTGKAISRYGVKHVIFFSIPFMIVFLAVLFWMHDNTLPILVPSLLFGFSRSIYWTSIDLDFALYTSKKNRGKSVGYFYGLPYAAKIIGPLAGGALIMFFGFNLVFVLAGALALLSIIPLFRSPDLVSEELKGWTKAFKRDFIPSFTGSLILGSRIICVLFLWPLFLFLRDLNFESIGLAYSVAGLVVVVSIFLLGMKADKKFSPRWVSIGAVGSSISWVIAFFVSTVASALIITTLISLATALWFIPLEKYVFNQVKTGHVMGGLFIRKLGRVTGSTLNLLVFFLALYYTSPMAAFGYAFSFNALLYLYPFILQVSKRSFFP